MMPPRQRALCPGTVRHISDGRCPAALPEPDLLPRERDHTTGTDGWNQKGAAWAANEVAASQRPIFEPTSVRGSPAAARGRAVPRSCLADAATAPIAGRRLSACCSAALPPEPSHGYSTSSRTEVPQRLLEWNQGMGQATSSSSGVSWNTTGYPHPNNRRLFGPEKASPCAALKGWEMWLHPGAGCSNTGAADLA